MAATYWHKQTNKALFPELEWNKPERRDQAGRLLIVGGNLHNLSAPAQAYEIARQTGIGDIQLALPHKTKRLVGATLPGALFLPSTQSGELAQEALPELQTALHWADTLLLPGDSGRNSQTTILLEQVLHASNQPAVLTRDALDSLQQQAGFIFNRANTHLVASFAQLQKLISQLQEPTAITYAIDLIKLVELLHELSERYAGTITTYHHNQIIVAAGGSVSTTKTTFETETHWRTRFATLASCYLTWNAPKPFESLTEAAYQTALPD